MKVVIVHDYIKEYGGAERVLEALHELFPNAPVYTSIYLPEYLGPHRSRFKNWKIRTSWAQFLPFKAKLISPLRVISPLLFRSFDFSEYDLIITSATGAYFPNALKKKNARLLCYCHTPPRYLYGYKTARDWQKNMIMKAIGMLTNHFLRMVDLDASKNVDQYIANSNEVRRRIKKFYRKDAIVINPPVEMCPLNLSTKKMGYFLTGGRLARAKHTDLIVRVCAKNNIPLKVFGKGFAGYGGELKELAKNNKNIELLGEISDEKKWEIMQGAKAFLFASEDEDFGILPVEAMSAGLPVIAYYSGGVKETVIEGKTGIFFRELNEECLEKAIQNIEETKFDPKPCIRQAEEFRIEVFKRKMKEEAEKPNRKLAL